MINSFKCQETERIFNGLSSRSFPADIQALAERKLRMLNASEMMEDLSIPPGNHFESLKGGRCSIKIDDKYKIYFNWIHGEAQDVEITCF